MILSIEKFIDLLIMSKFSFENIHFKNDFDKIKKSFLLNLNIKISKKFYLWRYLKNNKFFCYVVKKQKTIIGHVGFIKYKSQNGVYFVSRHSSFVNKIFRRKNLYSNLIKYCLNEFKEKDIHFILIWPNKINRYTNKKFNNLIQLPILKIYCSKKKKNNQIKLRKLKNINQIQKYIIQKKNSDLIKKDKKYFTWRYIDKKPKENFYYHPFENKNSVFIFNYNKKENIYNLLDHIGDRSYFLNHLKLINKKLNFILWVNKKIEEKKSFKDLNLLKQENKEFYSYIIPVKKFKSSNFKFLDLQMGDTDVFIQSF